MLVQSRLFIKSLSRKAMGISVCQVLWSTNLALAIGFAPGVVDLKNAKAVVSFMKRSFDKHDIQNAEHMYQAAIHRSQSRPNGSALGDGNWGAVAKYAAESAVLYPTAKAIVLLAEAELKFSGQRGDTTKKKAEILADSERYYGTALAIDEIQHQWSAQERQLAEKSRGCMQQYLKTRRPDQDCLPLVWLKIS